jgi:hypothetical protein
MLTVDRLGCVVRPLVRGTGQRRVSMERSYAMGDKGGKKDKNKSQKQKVTKEEQKSQKKQDKQPKSTP